MEEITYKRFCSVCGREWSEYCAARSSPNTHRELDYGMPLEAKISYLNEAVSWLGRKMYYEEYDRFKAALDYFTKFKIERQFKYHQVI